MTDFSMQPGPPELAAPQGPSPEAMPIGGSYQQLRDSLRLRQETDQAAEKEDWQAYDEGIIKQRQSAVMANMLIEMGGQNPARASHPMAMFVDPAVEVDRRMMGAVKEMSAMRDAIAASPYPQVAKWLEGVAERYREQNESAVIRHPKNEEELIAQIRQNRPVHVDPNEVADMRAMMLDIDKAMKAVDPTASVWTHPLTRKNAAWINREAGGGQLGFMASGEQEAELGWATPAVMGMEAIEGAADFGKMLVDGTWDLAGKGIRAIGGPDIGPLMPTNYIEGPDGKIYTNGGKIPSTTQALGMLYYAATEQNVQEKARELGKAEEFERATRNGLDAIMLGGSRVFGIGFGFGLPAGAAMKGGAAAFSQLGTKGMQALATGAMGERGLKITRLVSGGLGSMVGNGVAEGVAFGKAEGYGTAFMGGMMMAPVLVAIGAMGRGAERFLRGRQNMPGAVRAKIALGMGGVLEGASFATLEQAGVDGALWKLLKDPTQETWNSYAQSMAGFMMFKVLGGRPMLDAQQKALGQAFADAEVMGRRNIARARFAEQVAAGEVKPEVAASRAEAAKMTVEELAGLGRLSQRVREATDPAERQRLQDQLKELETELDRKELETGSPAARDVAEVQEGGIGAFAARAAEGGKEELLRKTQERIEARRREAEERGIDLDAPERTPEAVRKWGEITEADRRKVEAERRAAKEETPERREERIAETLDPLERMDYDTLPAELRKKIETAYSALERKRAYVEHFEGVGERRGVEDRRRAAGMEGRGELGARVGEARPGGAERYAPDRPGAEESTLRPGEKPTNVDRIYKLMEGRPGRRGFRIPFTAKVLGATKGDPVRVPLREGKVGTRGVLGFFRTFQNLIRTKESRDLVVSAHEWSHALQRQLLGEKGTRMFEAAKTEYEALIEAERRAGRMTMGQDGKLKTELEFEVHEMLKEYGGGAPTLSKATRWLETWSEWNARNLLGQTDLRTEFPVLSRIIEGILARNGIMEPGGQYKAIQREMDIYRRMGSVMRARQGIEGKQSFGEWIKSAPTKAWQLFEKGLLDDMADLKRSQREWLEAVGERPDDISILDDAPRMFDAIRMTADKVTQNRVFNRHKSLVDGEDVWSLREIIKYADSPDFETYLVERRNVELFQQGKTSQRPVEDHIYAVEALSRKNPTFEEAAVQLKRWTDSIVDYVVDAGNLDWQDGEKIKDSYAIYVPFFRAIEGPKAHGGGRGVAEGGTGVQRISGSTRRVKDPLNKLIDVSRQMIGKAHQNMVMQALYNMSKGREAGALATVIPRKSVPQNHPVKRIIDALERQIRMPGDKQHEFETVLEALRNVDGINDQTLTLFSQPVIPFGEKSVIAFTPRMRPVDIDRLATDSKGRFDPGIAAELARESGKVQWMEVNTKVYEALMGVEKMPNPLGDGILAQSAAAARDLVRFGATGVSLPFAVANSVRDALSAPIFDRYGRFRPLGGFADYAKGFNEFRTIFRGGKRTPTRQLYDEMGVAVSSFFHEGTRRKVLGGHRNLVRRSVQRVREVMDSIEGFIAKPENFIRITEFKNAYDRAIAAGKEPLEARLLALEAGREITVNFARAGIVGRAMNQLIPYFNAGLQGQRKFWRQLAGGDSTDPKMRARTQAFAFQNAFVNITIPSVALWAMFKDEEWYQDLPAWRRAGYFNFKLPGIDTIFSFPRPFEAGVIFGGLPELLLDEKGGFGAEVRKQMLLPYINDLANLTPALLRPAIEVSMGSKIFTGRRLTPEWIEKGAPPGEQKTAFTSRLGVFTADLINGVFGTEVSPIEADHMMAGHTAGLTTRISRFFEDDRSVLDRLEFINPFSRILKQTPHGQSRAVDELYPAAKWLGQREDELDAQARGLMRRMESAKRRMSDISRAAREGRITREESDRQRYEIARPLMDEFERMQNK